MGMLNRMAIAQMITEAKDAGADDVILDICRELLYEIEKLEEKIVGIEA